MGPARRQGGRLAAEVFGSEKRSHHMKLPLVLRLPPDCTIISAAVLAKKNGPAIQKVPIGFAIRLHSFPSRGDPAA